MSAWNHLFTDHPATVDESYFEHLASATGFGFRMIWGGIICLVHALIPGVCATRGSDMICDLHERMVTNRRRLSESRAIPMEPRRAA